MEEDEQLKYGKLIPKFQPSFIREKPDDWKCNTDIQILLEGDWKNNGNCVGEDSNKFFPTVKVDGEYLYTEEDAKEVCHACPVQRECLDFAIITKSDMGIFGGYTPEERKLLQHNYKRELELRRRKNGKQQSN
jgi:WhiB family transcriptional regulator, redox-sensing transcriptional regulator